jgi:TPP-dependent 2-oxoacid decarboxylase
VVVTTFTVGGLSAINAVAGAYSENLPLICITGECCLLYIGSGYRAHDGMAAAQADDLALLRYRRTQQQ